MAIPRKWGPRLAFVGTATFGRPRSAQLFDWCAWVSTRSWRPRSSAPGPTPRCRTRSVRPRSGHHQRPRNLPLRWRANRASIGSRWGFRRRADRRGAGIEGQQIQRGVPAGVAARLPVSLLTRREDNHLAAVVRLGGPTAPSACAMTLSNRTDGANVQGLASRTSREGRSRKPSQPARVRPCRGDGHQRDA